MGGACLQWDNLPEELLEAKSLKHGDELFSDGEAPRGSHVCARPLHRRRERPWCYCAGPMEGWAYCQPVLANCTLVPCKHEDNVCGSYRRPCHAVAGAQMFVSEEFDMRSDLSFRKVELGAFTK